jgi:uncharacterized membrane protein YkvA (DUF1232 family)
MFCAAPKRALRARLPTSWYDGRMSDADVVKYLETFPAWLASLPVDVQTLANAAVSASPEAAIVMFGGLNYVFKSLDLIPDGIDDLGYLDDAFVVRVAARHACALGMQSDVGAQKLAADVETVEAFLGADYARLDAYVQTRIHDSHAVRGRTAHAITSDEALRSSFLNELRAWSAQYVTPSFDKQPKTLAKLRAFLGAKLP